MKIFVATDIKVFFYNGKILANSKHSTILKRYYHAFGKIVLCSRCCTVEEEQKGFVDISDIIDSVVEVGSLYEMFLNKHNKKIEAAMQDCQLIVGRCHGIVAYKAADIAKKLNKPFFAECMGCAWDAYWNHSVVGKAIAPYMFFKMKSVVKNADYALYVTKEFLQKRYPCKNDSVAASNVLIEKIDELVLQNRVKNKTDKVITLMTTAAVNVKYKGQQYVIRAISKLNELGLRVKYILVGEGDDSYLRSEVKRLGVEDQVEFKGRLPLDEVFELLDEADIYIQPSLQEGLPRSMIEAMSRGCACIGAKTAGIPELIDDEFVVRRKSVSDIVDRIYKYANLSDEQKAEISKRNFEESKKYEVNRLNARREAYYQKVKEQISRQKQ